MMLFSCLLTHSAVFVWCLSLLSIHIALSNASSILSDEPIADTTIKTYCEYYNFTCVLNAKQHNLDEKICFEKKRECKVESEHVHSCYVTWKSSNDSMPNTPANFDADLQHSSGYSVLQMGCMQLHNHQLLDNCPDNETCNEYRSTDNVANARGGILHCCCRKNMCNTQFAWKPKSSAEPKIEKRRKLWPGSSSLLYILIPVTLLLLMIASYYGWYRHKTFHHPLLENNSQMEVRDTESLLMGTLNSIELTEIRAEGRFVVWKGLQTNVTNTHVAVKVFSNVDQRAWNTEKEIYKLLSQTHTNILKFVGAHPHIAPSMLKEFWLVTEFHERGSLYDVLSNYLLSWEDLCKISLGMARGLDYLHEDHGQKGKPSIAHRDFKSKNVLIKMDMTPCLADFGLALVFEQRGKQIGDTYPQVGTKRYMAPEVLEGAIIFSRDQFFRIDMYAYGLVLWELASRSASVWNQINPLVKDETHSVHDYDSQSMADADCSNIDPYTPPFETQARTRNPSLEILQDLVINQRVRPRLREEWNWHSGMKKLISTVNECWDHDAEARVSASCVIERLHAIECEPIVYSKPNAENNMEKP